MLTDFARCGRTKMLKPFRGKQRLALQRLTRYRKHLVDLARPAHILRSKNQ